MTYRHIVLFRVHDDVDDNRVTEAIERLRSLGVLPGIQSWRVELSLDTRKGRVIVEDASFVDRAAFEAFREHPEHTKTAETMADTSDWWIGDYETR
ncbi:stress responsive alpha/beta barrel protein [Microbacterium sp. SLBN-154]|uniref:Dabb family protein n=1 Tax=Microbacterium sp. SLBN-154 TaxID=2768458 RepID=UPI0011517BD7|nr:Dabb family protein [Microbacterium sp. SLBN-154]TQK18626.1 stress responsive alpha/beta barrel protein [Microbacterium sp. SLBN-154]